jgi:uncharacterized protein (DUF39 family)/NAD-dependent dihydropyrimidine dehydrogenase PreA subunit
MKSKTIEEINKRIKNGKAVVVTADEMTKIVKEIGEKRAFKEIDVVTTATFGAMCSSGVFLNFGHSDPPIKMTKVWLNDVPAYTGIAAVDAYIGATEPSEKLHIKYGGAHVIEDLLRGREINLRAEAYGTDCYPRKKIETVITLEELNQAIMLNPRNSYQRYNSAINSSQKILYTYMGKLLPEMGNVTFSGSGELSPLMNDPDFETIGIGTRIFLCGGEGYVVGYGTQHSPETGFATLMVKGDLKSMSSEFLRAAVFEGYGCTLYVGIGVPIPVLNEGIARKTGISDEEIFTNIIDYGVQSRNRPVIKRVSYKELKSGYVEINGKRVKTSPLSSIYMAKKIAQILKEKIEKGEFLLTMPVERLPIKGSSKPLIEKQRRAEIFVRREPPIPENQNIVKDDSICINCGQCISICPLNLFSMDENWKVILDHESCISCGICIDACPVKALNVRK